MQPCVSEHQVEPEYHGDSLNWNLRSCHHQPPAFEEWFLPTLGSWGWEGRSAVLPNTGSLLPPDERASSRTEPQGRRHQGLAGPHHALAVVNACQILLKLLSNLEVHNVVAKSAQRADDHVVAVLHDLFVWLQQVGDFAQGHVDICKECGEIGRVVF